MNRNRKNRPPGGFTLVEIIVGLAIIGVLFAIGVPVALRTIHTAKVSSVGYDCNILIRKAKSEAIRKNQRVIVKHHATWDVLRAFTDVHGATVTDPPDGKYTPDGGSDPLATDHEVGQCGLPPGLAWGGPTSDPDITVGFTSQDSENLAILMPDGTVEDIGTFRFGDARGNYLAIQIAPTATARVTLLKWDEETTKWREQGEEGKKWVWY